MNKTDIKKDWLNALDYFSHGADLADAIDYVLSKEDIRELAILHRAGNYKFKILELLASCKLNSVCEMFDSRNYDDFIY